MIESKSELEWFIWGVAIAGGKQKFKEMDNVFNDEDNVEDDSTEEVANIKL